MQIASEDIMIDVDDPSQERLIIKVIGVSCLSQVNPIADQRIQDGWKWESDFLLSDVAYVIFTRPIKTDVEWFGKMIEDRPQDMAEVNRILEHWKEIVFQHENA